MPLDIELPPIPDDIEVFLKMVPSNTVDQPLSNITTMTMGPELGHDYHLRPSSLRGPRTC